MTEEKKKGLSPFKKFLIAFALIVVVILGITMFNYYLRYMGKSVTDNEKYLYIKTGSSFDDVYATIREKEIVKDSIVFLWVAQNMDYPLAVKPGKYRLEDGMSNRALINMLKAGNQEEVSMRFRGLRLKQNFAAYVSKQIEPDSTTLINLLDSAQFVSKYGFNKENVYAMFIPNTYNMYWNISAESFFKRMYDEYQKFWNKERLDKAKALNMTPIQVSILAAIVDAEALHDKEMPTIAGLYLNRYKRGIKLQADPTVIYANEDFTIRRVLNRHLTKDSPYNTYVYAGLPPGPIMMPSINAIDAVLNYEKHNYIYMCAKEDFSGYHNFAVTVAEHQANARRFQQALNERNIKR
ncbi:MAG: endolytic transglycosylase MltG [Arcticibacter sp.]